ncbi:MAG: sodium/glutamate symporter [Desulfocapsaceae bacterium]
MKTILLDPTQTLVVAIIGYFVGRLLTEKVGILDKFRIPEAVTGGIVIAIGVTVLRGWGSVTVSFTPSDVAMLTFFTTIGLSARLSDLKAGGKTLVLTLLVCVLAVVAENLVGLGFAKLTGAPPAMGIMAGSVALIGGHGTAAAWAPLFESGSEAASAVGLASATFGLVAGGVVGSPLGRQLIMRNKLKPADTDAADLTLSNDEQRRGRIDVPQFFRAVLVIAIAIGVGEEINILLNQVGFKLPHFVTSLFAGILIANIGPAVLPRINWPTRSPAMRLIAELSLSIFLVRALMSLELWTLSDVAGPLLMVLVTQVMVVLALAYFLLFRILNRTYDAAIISSGFVGLSLGATPTAVANMDSLSNKFGPSPTAFLVIPLVGAFFIDLINAFVISMLYNFMGG